MPKSKAQKKEITNNLKDKFDRAKSVIFANYNALGVKENEELRKNLKKENAEYYSVKKTLLQIVLQDKGIEGVNTKEATGQLAAIFSYEDEVAPARIVSDWQKENPDKLNFFASYLEGKVLSAEQTTALAKIPSKQELYAKMVGSLNAPLSGLVNVLQGNLRNLVYVLKAIEEKK